MIVWRDGVVPLAVEFGKFYVEGGHLGIGDNNAYGVLASGEFTAHGEAGFTGRGRDQFDNHPITERLTENELGDFSRLCQDGCGQTITEVQDVDRNHSAEV